jgi:hypothetical protein
MSAPLFVTILFLAFQSVLTFRAQPLPWSALRCARLHAEPLNEDVAKQKPVLMTITLSVTDGAPAEVHQVSNV